MSEKDFLDTLLSVLDRAQYSITQGWTGSANTHMKTAVKMVNGRIDHLTKKGTKKPATKKATTKKADDA